MDTLKKQGILIVARGTDPETLGPRSAQSYLDLPDRHEDTYSGAEIDGSFAVVSTGGTPERGHLRFGRRNMQLQATEQLLWRLQAKEEVMEVLMSQALLRFVADDRTISTDPKYLLWAVLTTSIVTALITSFFVIENVVSAPKSPRSINSSNKQMVVQRDAAELNRSLSRLSANVAALTQANDRLIQMNRAAVDEHGEAREPRLPVANVPSVKEFHYHDFQLSISAPPFAQVHEDMNGMPDYWLVQSRDGAPTKDRVQPFGSNNLGVSVHDMDDGRDYILTRSGGWILIEPRFDQE